VDVAHLELCGHGCGRRGLVRCDPRQRALERPIQISVRRGEPGQPCSSTTAGPEPARS
jgi:hypothetical protein